MISKAQIARARQITKEVVELQRELFEMGLPATSRIMAAVSEKIGWELAEKMRVAGLGKDY